MTLIRSGAASGRRVHRTGGSTRRHRAGGSTPPGSRRGDAPVSRRGVGRPAVDRIRKLGLRKRWTVNSDPVTQLRRPDGIGPASTSGSVELEACSQDVLEADGTVDPVPPQSASAGRSAVKGSRQSTVDREPNRGVCRSGVVTQGRAGSSPTGQGDSLWGLRHDGECRLGQPSGFTTRHRVCSWGWWRDGSSCLPRRRRFQQQPAVDCEKLELQLADGLGPVDVGVSLPGQHSWNS